MKKQRFYLAVDLDREIFKDDKGNEYTPEQTRQLINKSLIRDVNNPEKISVDLTMMAARLINEFNFDFEATRKYYDSVS